MGSDLQNILKIQRLTDEQIQLLIYQVLRGLKVCPVFDIPPSLPLVAIIASHQPAILFLFSLNPHFYDVYLRFQSILLFSFFLLISVLRAVPRVLRPSWTFLCVSRVLFSLTTCLFFRPFSVSLSLISFRFLIEFCDDCSLSPFWLMIFHYERLSQNRRKPLSELNSINYSASLSPFSSFPVLRP